MFATLKKLCLPSPGELIGRQRIITLILIMAVFSIIIASTTLGLLYSVAFDQFRSQLIDITKNQAALYSAVAKFDKTHDANFVGGAKAGTLSQIKSANSQFSGFGTTGEFTLAQHSGDAIEFVLSQRGGDRTIPEPVPMWSKLAEPMHLALSGKSGSLIGKDYRGKIVLAAFQPVPELDMAVVTKMDLAEIRQPFLEVGLVIAAISLCLILVATILFLRIGDPLISSLQKTSQQLHEAQRIAHLGSWSFNLTTEELWWSDELYQLIGLEPQSIPASHKNILELVHSEDRAVLKKWRTQLLHYAPTDPIETRLVLGDGSIKVFRITATLATDPIDMTKQINGIMQDITEQHLLAAQLQQSQKMEAVGQLTGGIAHDFNNMLGIIMGNLDLLRHRITADPEAMKYVHAAYRGVERGAKITNKLLQFSRREVSNPRITNINNVIADMQSLLSKTLTPKIAIQLYLADPIWPVNIDSGALEDALLNLTLNARDAMPDGGTLMFETCNKELDQNYARHNPTATAGDYVQLSVSDTGTGMTREVIENAFLPFFTTKDVAQGTGLGLSMVYRFAEQAGGHVKIYSTLGKGTTFRIYLPKSQQQAIDASAKAHEITAKSRHQNLTILVVDDEEDLLESAVSLLHNLGCSTHAARDAQQALQILQEHPQINVLFTDVVMPGPMDGYALVKEALKTHPEIKVILTSGFTFNREKLLRKENGWSARLPFHLLNKPYTQQELAAALLRAMPPA